MKKLLKKIRRHLLNLSPGSTDGSKARNFVSYYTLFLLFVILAALSFEKISFSSLVSAIAIVVFAFVYFYIVIISVIFLVSRKFEINPIRLIRDIMISMAYTVMSFAYLFKQLGIADSSTSPLKEYTGNVLTYIYFSAVTFSTLGFGDFRPMPEARFAAATEALFGNLHLGLIAGAVYYLISTLSKK